MEYTIYQLYKQKASITNRMLVETSSPFKPVSSTATEFTTGMPYLQPETVHSIQLFQSAAQVDAVTGKQLRMIHSCSGYGKYFIVLSEPFNSMFQFPSRTIIKINYSINSSDLTVVC